MSAGLTWAASRRYAGCMRYAQGGGLTAEGRRRREQVRLEAARRFEQGAPAAVIAAAHENALIDARSVSYVEAHGTATPLGDPIEVDGLTRLIEIGERCRATASLARTSWAVSGSTRQPPAAGVSTPQPDRCVQ